MLKKILIGLLVFVVLVLVFHSFIIGTLVKPQAEKQVSKILGTDVAISVLSVRLWPGNAAIYGLKIKNPSGFSSENLLDLGSASVSLNVPGLIKQFAASDKSPKTVVIDEIKIKGLKFLFERALSAQGPLSNVEKLVKNMEAAQPQGKNLEAGEDVQSSPETKPTAEVQIEIKHFIFSDGRVTVKDATVGKGFDYVVDDIDIDFKNIFLPAKPALELVEEFDVSAQLGTQSPGRVSLQGRSNLMAGANVDAALLVEAVSLMDFNAFVADQPFEIKAGTFDLKSKIKILENELESEHDLKLASMVLGSRSGGESLMDLPMQTLISALSRVPSLHVPFEVNGNLQNPQFKITQAIRSAIGAGVQKVLAAGLGDLKGLATGLKGQALDFAGGGTAKVTDDAKKIVQGIAGEGSGSIEDGLKKLSGLLGKPKDQ